MGEAAYAGGEELTRDDKGGGIGAKVEEELETLISIPSSY